MAFLRYAKSNEQLAAARAAGPGFLRSEVRSIRAIYETDPELIAALLPRPLEPAARPEVHVIVSDVTIHLPGEMTFPLGAGTFGVTCRCDGVDGLYPITMPMTTEGAVVAGREIYGEPKKLADVTLTEEDGVHVGRITRMGITYVELRGRALREQKPTDRTDRAYTFKVLPSPPPAQGFDVDPLLCELEWKLKMSSSTVLDGEVILSDSPFDPVADLPVRKVVALELEVSDVESGGKVLKPVKGEWLLPFLHQRYDDPMFAGLEVAVASERAA